MRSHKKLKHLISKLSPRLNEGDYVFVSVKSTKEFSRSMVLFEFKEKEGTTIVLSQKAADQYNLKYTFIACWITLEVYSSLNAIGLTAAISTALTKHEIPCNIVAGYHHDHLFVRKELAAQTMSVLRNLSSQGESEENL